MKENTLNPTLDITPYQTFCQKIPLILILIYFSSNNKEPWISQILKFYSSSDN